MKLTPQTFTVVVPLSNQHIVKGSAVVCRPADLELLKSEGKAAVAYYEGSIYSQGMSYRDKLIHAAGRMAQRYPTAALTAFADSSEFKVVGSFNTGTQRLTLTDEQALLDWGVNDPLAATVRPLTAEESHKLALAEANAGDRCKVQFKLADRYLDIGTGELKVSAATSSWRFSRATIDVIAAATGTTPEYADETEIVS